MSERLSDGYGSKATVSQLARSATLHDSALRGGQVPAQTVCRPPGLEDGQSVFGPEHEHQGWRFWTGCDYSVGQGCEATKHIMWNSQLYRTGSTRQEQRWTHPKGGYLVTRRYLVRHIARPFWTLLMA